MTNKTIFKIPDAPQETPKTEDLDIEFTNQKEKWLYDEIIKEAAYIENKIRSGEQLSKKERKIVRSQISNRLNLNDSYITHRRFPCVHQEIESQNARLEELYCTIQKVRNDKNHKKSLTQMTKADLISEVRRLQKQISDFDHELIALQVTKIIDSGLVSIQHRAGLNTLNQRLENEKLIRQIADLIEVRHALEEELSQEIDRRRMLEIELNKLRGKSQVSTLYPPEVD